MYVANFGILVHNKFLYLCVLQPSFGCTVVLEIQSPETQHGAIMALGYMVGRYMSKRRTGMPNEATPIENKELIAMATKTIGTCLSCRVSFSK